MIFTSKLDNLAIYPGYYVVSASLLGVTICGRAALLRHGCVTSGSPYFTSALDMAPVSSASSSRICRFLVFIPSRFLHSVHVISQDKTKLSFRSATVLNVVFLWQETKKIAELALASL